MNVDPMGISPTPAMEQLPQPTAHRGANWQRPLGWYGFVPGAAIVVYGTAFLLLSKLVSL